MMDKSNDEFKFQLYAPEYREQTIALLGLLWKKVKPERHSAFFKWKYEDNPYSESPLIMICIAEEKVVGALGHMIQRLMINGTPHNICVPVDGIVHPDYRMYGIYSKMLREGLRNILSLNDIYDLKFFFNASSNAASAPGLVKYGWKSLSPRTYYNKFSLINLLFRLKRRYVSQDFSLAFSRRSPQYRLEITSEVRIKDMEIILSNRVDKIYVIHDLEFFNWKYCLNKENYKYVYLYSGSIPAAYMVLNCGSSKQSSIEEYGFNEYQSLQILVTKTMQSMRLGILRLFVANIPKEEISTLHKSGFMRESKVLLRLLKKKVRTPVYIKTVNGNGSGQDYYLNGINCLDGKNWRLFHADIL